MKKLITEESVNSTYSNGSKTIVISDNDIVTPAAYDKIRQLKLEIVREKPHEDKNPDSEWNPGRVVIGSDHTGFNMKQKLIDYLRGKNYYVKDVGTNNESSCDYPDFATAVVGELLESDYCFGIILDATGIPSAITANKFPGIRAATCYNEFSAQSARAHNNSNILVMGAKTLGEETIKSILNKFIATPFEGERHQRRLDKIKIIEEKLLNKR